MTTIRIQTASHFPINRPQLKSAVEHVLTEQVQGNVEVSITIVGDRLMRKLNKTYRKIDDTTDVLSFPQHDPSQAMHQFASPPDNILYLGDIVLSYPQAVSEAGEDHMMVDDKILELVLHGLDHLLGIHHE